MWRDRSGILVVLCVQSSILLALFPHEEQIDRLSLVTRSFATGSNYLSVTYAAESKLHLEGILTSFTPLEVTRNDPDAPLSSGSRPSTHLLVLFTEDRLT